MTLNELINALQVLLDFSAPGFGDLPVAVMDEAGTYRELTDVFAPAVVLDMSFTLPHTYILLGAFDGPLAVEG